MPIVVGLGEVLWDLFGDARRPGGAPANVAFHANQLGLTGVVMSRVGNDDIGRDLLTFLKTQGLTTDYIQIDPDRPTGTVTVRGTPSGPEFTIHENVAWDRLDVTPQWASLLETADVICFGTLAQRSPDSRQTIEDCFDHMDARERIFDVNLRQNWYSRDIILDSLERATVVKLNETEVPIVADLIAAPVDPAPFARALHDRYDTDLVCVTLGAEGCLAFSNNERVRVPPENVPVADTVGAGDAFTAGLIFARLQGWPLERTARFANAVGGLVASRPGAMPDLKHDFARLKEQFT